MQKKVNKDMLKKIRNFYQITLYIHEKLTHSRKMKRIGYVNNFFFSYDINIYYLFIFYSINFSISNITGEEKSLMYLIFF